MNALGLLKLACEENNKNEQGIAQGRLLLVNDSQ